MKKILSLILVAVMLLTVTPIVYAETNTVIDAGFCDSERNVYGDIWWMFCSDGTLHIEVTSSAESSGDPDAFKMAKAGAWGSYKSQITSIVLDDKLTKIVGFRDFTNVSEPVILPSGLIEIGDFAFYNCSMPGPLLLPSSLEKIGSHAFAYCSELFGDIVIPSGVNEISEKAFLACGINSEKSLNVTISEGVTVIEGQAFYSSNLTNISIPETVIDINTGAYQYGVFSNTPLREVVLPSSISTVNPYTFKNCRNLVRVTLPDDAQVCMGAFSGCTNLNDIYVNDIHVVLGSFEKCFSAENVLEKICDLYFFSEWEDAFKGCSGVSELHLSQGSIFDLRIENLIKSCSSSNEAVVKFTYGESLNNYAGHNFVRLSAENTGVSVLTGFSETNDEIASISINVHNYGEWKKVDENLHIKECLCGKVYNKKHSWNESIIIEKPTHLTEGTIKYICECGDSYTDIMAKLKAHSYTSEIITEPTHLKEGEAVYSCECGDSYIGSIAKLKGHTYVSVLTNPTCTKQGYTTYTCECGDTYVDDYVDVIDHNYTFEITTPATHLVEGVKTFTCACGDTYNEPIAKLTGHTYTSKVTTPATHLTEGVETFTCACGDSYTKSIEKLEHDYKSVTTEPTCTNQGYTTYTCECGDMYISDYIDASHIWSDWTNNEYNQKIRICLICNKKEIIGEIKVGEIKNLTANVICNAVYLDWDDVPGNTIIYDVFCKFPGSDSYILFQEGDMSESESYFSIPGVFWYKVMAFAIIDGEFYDGEFSEEICVEVKEHSYTSKIITPATHLIQGKEKFTCYCGDTYTKIIPKIEEHTYIQVVTEPTCTSKGYTTYICECGDNYLDDYVDAKGHSYLSEITIPATHLNIGMETFTCACGDIYTAPIKKLEKHTYVQVVTEPTCTLKGYTTYICECGDNYISDYINVTAHNYISTTIAPTCSQNGLVTTFCTNCGNTKIETISAIGHNFNGSKCSNCGYDKAETCSCNCHKSGLMGIIWKIINIFNKLLRKNQLCNCGVTHY